MKTISLILPLVFFSLPAFALESADMFVRPGFSERIVFQDLSGKLVPSFESDGDRIILPAGTSGAWADFRTLNSFGFLEQRLESWNRSAPKFAALMRATARVQPDWIATPFSIQPASSSPAFPGGSVPGAYLSNARLFVDIKVWNRAGLQSQAALILHELLRANQARLKLADDFVKGIVFRVIEEEPSPFFHDELFSSDPNVLEGAPPHPATPDSEVASAIAVGIIGGDPGHAAVSPCYDGPGKRPDGGSDAGHSGGQGCEFPRQ
jgi:hypothetical protein